MDLNAGFGFTQDLKKKKKRDTLKLESFKVNRLNGIKKKSSSNDLKANEKTPGMPSTTN